MRFAILTLIMLVSSVIEKSKYQNMLFYTAARRFRVQWPVLEKNRSTHSWFFLLLF
jgi:hypothetical protein